VQKHVETLDAIYAKNAAAPAKANSSMDVDGHAKARHTARRSCHRGGTSSSLPRRLPRRAGSSSTCCRRYRPHPRWP
jgi:hypothetical protein